MKKNKSKLKSSCKEYDFGHDCTAKGWISHMVDFHYGDEAVYDKFPVPLGTAKLSGYRFILPVTPANPSGMTGWLSLEYDSDVKNDNFESSINDHGLYRHRIVHKDLDLSGVIEAHLIDESFSFDLEFDYNNVQYLNAVYLVEGKAEGGLDIHPIVSFEFNGCKCCKGGKKEFNFHF